MFTYNMYNTKKIFFTNFKARRYGIILKKKVSLIINYHTFLLVVLDVTRDASRVSCSFFKNFFEKLKPPETLFYDFLNCTYNNNVWSVFTTVSTCM